MLLNQRGPSDPLAFKINWNESLIWTEDLADDGPEVPIIQREQINSLSDVLRRFINLRIGPTVTHEELKAGFDSAVLEAIRVLHKIGGDYGRT